MPARRLRSNLCSVTSRPCEPGEANDPDLGQPIAAPLERCAELLGVDLAVVREAATSVEPYIRADGTSIWSLTQLERQLRPEAYSRRRGRLRRLSTDPDRRHVSARDLQ
jgi:hypothetical protein